MIYTQLEVRWGHEAQEYRSSDRVASYNLIHENVLGAVSPCANPQVVENHPQTFKDFFVHGNHILSHILTDLDTHLDLPTGTLAFLVL